MERLQTEVKSCSSVATTFLNGIDLARFMVVGREQAKNDAARGCSTLLKRYRAERRNITGLKWVMVFTFRG